MYISYVIFMKRPGTGVSYGMYSANQRTLSLVVPVVLA